MTLVYVLIALLIACFLIFWIVGSSMKREWVISRNIFIKAPVNEVWDTVTDAVRQIEWRKNLQKVELKDSEDDRQTWVEILQEGDPITRRVINEQHHKLYEMELVPTSIYEGNMSLEFTSSQAGTTVRFTESIAVNSALKRPFSKMSAVLENRLNQYQTDLKTFLEGRD